MKETLCQAITDRLVIKFIYDGQIRIVEPFVLGYHKDTGNLVIRTYRIGGFSKSEHEPPWRLFNIDKISELEVTGSMARSDRENYNPNDKHMSEILCHA